MEIASIEQLEQNLMHPTTCTDHVLVAPSSSWMSGKKIKKKDASTSAGGAGGGCAVM